MRSSKVIHIVDCHVEGEVGDVIVGGVVPPPGDTLWEQSHFIAKDQTPRNFVLNEPETRITLEAPDGLVEVRAASKHGKVEKVTVQNVALFADKLGANSGTKFLQSLESAKMVNTNKAGYVKQGISSPC